MFCTGGIRCEKASSYMLEQGFEEVYHLKGGILQYLEDMPQERSLWDGNALSLMNASGLSTALKLANTNPADLVVFQFLNGTHEPKFEEGVSCPHCYDDLTDKKRQRARARHEQVLLAEQRGYKHIGR
jgi:UPF0176 protein